MIISLVVLIFIMAFGATNVLQPSPSPSGLIPMLDGRIVGGQDTRIEYFPHQISMRYMGNHRCGGSIIGQRMIVTAAHCVDRVLAAFLAIRAGITERDDVGEERLVGRIIMHGNYNRQNMDNDIALLSLLRGFEYSSKIRPITLSGTAEEVFAGRSTIVSGWGATREGGAASTTLKFVELQVVADNECSRMYSRNGIRVTENMICAGVMPEGGKDACQGDSGGPLIVYNSNGQQQLIGVVSWGYGCARPQYPGVFSRISSFRRWIDEAVRVLRD